MKSTYLYSDIGTACLDNLFLVCSSNDKLPVCKENIPNKYRVKIIVDFVIGELFYPDNFLGNKNKVTDYENIYIKKGEHLFLENSIGGFKEKIINPLNSDYYNINISFYEDYPINTSGILEIIPSPINILTVFISIFTLKNELNARKQIMVQKHFDEYSYLGFLLADLNAFRSILKLRYGDKPVDLVYELANSDIVDELFEAGMFIITWGINPFSYPIYSCEDISSIESILGIPSESVGVYKIMEDINELSIIPGHRLKDWPFFLEEKWPKIKLYGNGKKVYLKPYIARDDDNMAIIPSFAIFRTDEEIDESRPLLNINLLS